MSSHGELIGAVLRRLIGRELQADNWPKGSTCSLRSGGGSLAIVWTTNAVYFISHAHLGPLQRVLLGTVMQLSILVGDSRRPDRTAPSFPALLGSTLLALLVLSQVQCQDAGQD